MATVDLRPLTGNEFVFHFGGRPNEVDAFTFANSILAFSEALREISRQINPEARVEIAIDAVGTGSFRARMKTATSMIGLFKKPASELAIAILAIFIYEKAHPQPPIQIIVEDDSYVVQHGEDRIILPKFAGDLKKKLPHPEEVDTYVSRAFSVLEEDPSVTELGITPNIGDKFPLAIIPRDDFGRLSVPGLPGRPDPKKRATPEPAELVVVRAVLERSDRKWQFIWRGLRISAPIKDPTFFDRLAAHEFQFGQGDVLVAELTIHQSLDDITGAWVNDFYEVTRVISKKPPAEQKDLLR